MSGQVVGPFGYRRQVMAEDEGASPPTAAVGPITVPPLPFVTGIAGFGTVVVACRWAAPRDGDPRLFLADLAIFGAIGGLYLLSFAWARLIRLALVCVPFWVVGVVRGIAAYLAGGWAGGWLLGAAGAAVGAAAGAAAGWLFVWAFADLCNRHGAIGGVIGGWSRGGPRGVARAAAWAVVGAAAGFLDFAWLSAR
jgi:hypothetical protein